MEESSNRDLQLIISLLESGHSVELPAIGYSMFPTLKPGDKVLVKSAAKEHLPQIGSLVVCKENNTLVIHRLVQIKNGNDGFVQLVSRGDSRKEPDIPWTPEQLIGIAVRFKRYDREHTIKLFIPSKVKYKINSCLLWLYLKLLRLRNLSKAAHPATVF